MNTTDNPNIAHAFNITNSMSQANNNLTENTFSEIINCDLDNDKEKNRFLEMVLQKRNILNTSDEDICGANLPPHRIELYDDTPI